MKALRRAVAVAFAIGPWMAPDAHAQLGVPTLDPAAIPKYVDPLVIPPVMPASTGPNQYEIAVRQFQQRILPSTGWGALQADPFPVTTVWSYGSIHHPGTFHYPAFTIEARWSVPLAVKWINGLVDENGEYLRHLLPVDTTLHWANPEARACMVGTPDVDCLLPYTGPVPIVTHVHGAETYQDSDGYPEAWYLPDATNIPASYARTGKLYDEFKSSSPLGAQWEPGSAVFRYPNMQRATTLWYHDHALGITRLNVYAGPAGFYLLRGGPDGDAFVDDQATRRAMDGVLPGPAPKAGQGVVPLNTPGDPVRSSIREIPVVVQDRSFNSDGSLFYPDSREFFDGFGGPYFPADVVDLESILGTSDVPPIWNPEFFGNTLVVNGRTWPRLDVAQALYRFRFLNGSQSRFLILTTSDAAPSAGNPVLAFWQLAAEGGFLPAPVPLTELLIGPAERADVIVDFRGLADGTEIVLLNLGPDEPFGGGVPFEGCASDPPDPHAPPGCFEPSDPATTGQVMKLVVNAALNGASPTDPGGATPATDPADLALPQRRPYGAETTTRYLSLNEEVSGFAEQLPAFDIPVAAKLGTVDPDTMTPTALPWHAAITEQPAVGTTEIWEIWNFTEDAHPIHIHLVQFEVLGRAVLGDPSATSIAGSNAALPWETGTKDTVVVYPGELTRVKAHFGSSGLYVWHCHILEHEDNEMMRPYCILNADGTAPSACTVASPPLPPD